MSAQNTRPPWKKVDVEPGPIKEWISVTGNRDDPMYDQSTYDTSSDMRQFSWRVKDEADKADTDPECPGELLVEVDPDEGDTVGNMYCYGTGDKPVPLRIYMALKFAAIADKKVPIESPARGGKPDSSVGQYFYHELNYRVQNNPDAFGHRDNFENVTPDKL